MQRWVQGELAGSVDDRPVALLFMGHCIEFTDEGCRPMSVEGSQRKRRYREVLAVPAAQESAPQQVADSIFAMSGGIKTCC